MSGASAFGTNAPQLAAGIFTSGIRVNPRYPREVFCRNPAGAAG